MPTFCARTLHCCLYRADGKSQFACSLITRIISSRLPLRGPRTCSGASALRPESTVRVPPPVLLLIEAGGCSHSWSTGELGQRGAPHGFGGILPTLAEL